MLSDFYKKNPHNKIWWVDDLDETTGDIMFSYDKKTIFHLFSDYPYKLTEEQKKIFDAENPYWAEFFKDR